MSVCGAVEDLAWSPDGRYLAAASASSMVQVWDGASGRTVFRYPGFPSFIWALAWSPDGQRLAYGTGSRLVQKNEPHVHAARAEVWDITTKTRLLSYHGFAAVIGSELTKPNFVSAIAWSPDGEQIATAYGGEVQVWGAADGAYHSSYTRHSGFIQCLAWSPNSRFMAVGGGEKTVHVWQLE